MIVPREGQELARRGRQAPPAEGIYPGPPRRLPVAARAVGLAAGALLVIGAGAALGLARFGGSYTKADFSADRVAPALEESNATPADQLARIEKRLKALAPAREVYVVVDTHRNRLRVYRGQEMLREAVCSTGSGIKLRDPRNGKEWIFDTPQGELKVLRKVKDPIWMKPDWAFIEDGYLPPKGMRERVDDFSLGDYALYMRDGYIIHGTVFQSLLGKRVTHGCIRLGDKDLEFVYKTVPAGARVFLF